MSWRRSRQHSYLCWLLSLLLFGSGPGLAKSPRNFLFIGSGELDAARPMLERPDIDGVQVVYNWRQLETGEGRYNFDAIEQDLKTVQAAGKKLFVQVQDRFFEPAARNIPDYLLTEPQFGGGLAPQTDNPGEGKPMAAGWVTMQWHPPVQARFQALLGALAERFDGRIYGLNLPETAADFSDSKPDGFSCDAYFMAELSNIAFARKAFSQTHVVQYVNFWPCEWNNDHEYMSRMFAFAADNQIGLGGPDIVPYRRAQMKNSYPFFNSYKGKLPLVAMAVQEPTLTYIDSATNKPFTREDIVTFAEEFLGVDVIFWTTQADWLRAPSPAEAWPAFPTE